MDQRKVDERTHSRCFLDFYMRNASGIPVWKLEYAKHTTPYVEGSVEELARVIEEGNRETG